jgi:Glycosyl hydrolases family 31/Domain of unknown function (DUF5110)
MRRLILPAILLAFVAVSPSPAAAAKSHGPFEVIDGAARIEVLSPTLFRLEYAADGRFENGPTLTALHRRRTRGKVRTKASHGIRVIKTSRAVLRYRIGSGPFNASNLKLTLLGGVKRQAVRPSFGPSPGNLGGWYRGLDGIGDAIPLHDGILSRAGWYLLDDSSSPLLIDNGRWYAPRPQHSGPYQDGYLFAYAHDYAAGLRDFRDLTGPAPLLPRKAFGVWFSRYAFYSARDYQQLVAQFRARRVPLDVLMIDTDYKAPNPWNGWEWTPVFGDDPAGFLKWAHTKGLDVALNVHPSIAQNDPSYPAANAAAGGLAHDSGRCEERYQGPDTPCGVWDWAQRDDVASYFSLHAPFERDGVDFWWLDWNNDESNAKAPGLTPDTWINSLYAQREADRGSRWLVLSRIGSSFWNYGGVSTGAFAEHRDAIHFTGDAYPRWPMLNFEIRFTTAEGAGIGLPYVSHDIGSFQGGLLPSDLYVRWLQFGAFQPILRLHSDHGFRLPWEYDKRTDRIASGFLRLRESLVPYIYTAARQAYDSGLPIARPMYLGWPGDNRAYHFGSQYMLGDELLVAPVAKAGPTAAKRVWFPAGDWVDIFTGAVHHGSSVQRLSVPLGRMPVFARAGSIIPRRPYESHVGDASPKQLALDVYAGADGSYDLYEDANQGFGYQNGAYARTGMHWSQGAAGGTVTIDPTRGHYDGMPAKRRYLVRVIGVDRPSEVTLRTGGASRELRSWSYDPSTRRLEVPIGAVAASQGASVTVDTSRPPRSQHGHRHHHR